MDARIIWDHWGGDLAIISGDVLLTDGLETAVILSLFLDARARDDDPLPDGGTDRRGWWDDDASPTSGCFPAKKHCLKCCDAPTITRSKP